MRAPDSADTAALAAYILQSARRHRTAAFLDVHGELHLVARRGPRFELCLFRYEARGLIGIYDRRAHRAYVEADIVEARVHDPHSGS